MSVYAKYVQGEPLMVDYTPPGATSGTAGGPVLAGDVLVINGAVRIAHRPATLAADGSTYNQMALSMGLGVYDGLKSGVGAVSFADGDPVFWSASSMLFTATSTDTFAGYAIGASGATATTVRFAHVLPGTIYSGNLVASGTLTVAGNASMGGTLAVTGATTLSSTLAAGATTITGALSVSTTSSLVGVVTFGAPLKLKTIATPVAAAGSAYTDAAAIGAADVVVISSDSAAKGVKLLTGVAGQVIRIINSTATACKLYPATGGTLSGLSANANVTIAASHIIKCICTAADTWTVVDEGAALAA
jgi:hypothetical protein